MVVEAGDHDEIGAGQPVEGAVGKEGEAAAHGDRCGVGGDAAQVEGGGSAIGAVGAPDLGDDGDVEGADPGEGDQRDAVRVLLLSKVLHGWQ